MTGQRTEPEDLDTLYRRAFKDYGSRALWNMRPIDAPTPADALAVTKALRTQGGMEGRRLAEQIQRLCRLGDENIWYTGALATPVPDGADISIVPAISGG